MADTRKTPAIVQRNSERVTAHVEGAGVQTTCEGASDVGRSPNPEDEERRRETESAGRGTEDLWKSERDERETKTGGGEDTSKGNREGDRKGPKDGEKREGTEGSASRRVKGGGGDQNQGIVRVGASRKGEGRK